MKLLIVQLINDNGNLRQTKGAGSEPVYKPEQQAWHIAFADDELLIVPRERLHCITVKDAPEPTGEED